ncbi:type II toxin-antitoxin system RelE/ParE family toxin [Sphingobium terrigena]|uniref:Type II toxin-antitoxin system RelE/ParE family toxin n=1 Tax=Sphingobium terrigena TaxID=2304063 RepID=A0A418YSF0_9SPHN|nr:type II toxin-antitoxin system RelE/ParE family toxin [Sphingobium terrigena]RJG54653.1 type II toxin-antitoxin system RelE/ParE family toxin [Sphingobium terrigena]
MATYRVQEAAGRRLDEIYIYTRDTWGEAQAEHYIRALFGQFEAIAGRGVMWRAIPAEFGVDGYYCRFEHHYIYWRLLPDGTIGIVTLLHERMHQMDRFRDDLP